MSQSDDQAVAAILALARAGKVPSYDWLRGRFGPRQISEAVYHSLNRGRAILSTVEQLDQYLFSYAPMVASQWRHASQFLVGRNGSGSTRIIDYGCGQGLAGLLLHDQLGQAFLADAQVIIAIEPSSVALRRASAIYGSLAPLASVIAVNKEFDAISNADLAAGDGETIHIFSNVLDIDGYDHVALLRKGLRPGSHTVIALGSGLIAVRARR